MQNLDNQSFMVCPLPLKHYGTEIGNDCSLGYHILNIKINLFLKKKKEEESLPRNQTSFFLTIENRFTPFLCIFL